ncbi:MAG: Ig-like domain-containing protein [Fibrobacterota bacterium]|nr:Ig-like domain-containing protein [Fibrobacterota bacterium]
MTVKTDMTSGGTVPTLYGLDRKHTRRFHPGLFLLFALALSSLFFWSCNTKVDDEYTVTFKLDSARVGKFDSVRVEIYNGAAPVSGDTTKPVQVKTIAIFPTTKEVSIQLSSKVKKDFSAVVTGFSGGDIAYRKLHTIDGFKAPDSTKPSVLLVSRIRVEDLTLSVGETRAPKVTLTPDNAGDKRIVLFSKDSDVAIVVGDSLKGIKSGSLTATAATADLGVTFAFSIRVVDVRVTELKTDSLSLKVGDSATPVVIVHPANATDKEYTLESSDTTVLLVSGKSVKALKAGKVNLILASRDEGFAAEFQVTVQASMFEVKGVKASSLRALVGDTVTPDIAWIPENASNKGYTLRALDTNLIIMNERAITKVLGRALAEITTADGGLKDTFEISVERANFKTDLLPITSIKCSPCHVLGTNLNFQDSVSLLVNGSKAIDRLSRAPNDPSKMPVKEAPNGPLNPRQLETLLEWLTARVTPLKNVAVKNDSVQLLEEKNPPITWDPPNASNKSYTLTSLDTTKVKISGGQVVGVNFGQAQIQLRALDGDKLVAFVITVIPTAVDSISISDTSATMGDTITPLIAYYPANATNKTYSLTKFRPASTITTLLPGKRIVANDQGKDTLVATSADGAKVSQFTVKVGPVIPTKVDVPDTNGTATGPLVTPRLLWIPANTTNKNYTLSITAADTGIAAVRTTGTQIQGKTVGFVNVMVTSIAFPSVTRIFKFTVGAVNVVSLSAAPIITFPNVTLNPVITWNPSNATNKTFTMVSGDTAKVKIVANQASTKKLGSVKITITSVDGSKSAPWDLTIIRSPFSPPPGSLLVFPKSVVINSCGACHNPSFALTNWQDSTTAVLNRAEMLRRIGLPLTHLDHMPPSDQPQPTGPDLTTLKNWLSQE